MTTLIEINELKNKFSDLTAVKLELKRLQSIKCRLQKQKGHKSYSEKMTEVLQQEQAIKEVRRLLDDSKKPVTEYNQADVDMLDYDETIKALRSIQSKKSLTKWLNDREGDNDEYREACRIEQMLLSRRSEIKPVDEANVRKSAINEVIERIQLAPDLTNDEIVEMLQQLI